jgi:Tfp pilus assembly protein PilV
MKNLKKCSFSLLELVVAIVIIGISVTSIPMFLNTVSNNFSTSSKESSFFNAYALLDLIQKENWDENNTKADNYYKVLTSINGDVALKCPRKGVLQLNNKSGAECATADNKTSHIGIDSGENDNDSTTFDDVDDFNGYSTTVGGYSLSISVFYITDNANNYNSKTIFFNQTNTPLSHDSNIKLINVAVNDSAGNLVARLKYFSSNIGMISIESRNE